MIGDESVSLSPPNPGEDGPVVSSFAVFEMEPPKSKEAGASCRTPTLVQLGGN